MDKIKVYVCNKGHRIVTTQDASLYGKIPFMILCREKDCQSDAMQQFNGHNLDQEAEWEWYKPTDEDIKAEMRGKWISGEITKEQYDKAYKMYKSYSADGTLLLRKIKESKL